jgi:hypothetical protein
MRMGADEMIRILEEIIRDPETNATARCTAIRTLREIPEPPAADAFADLDGDVLPLTRRRARAPRADNS